MRKLSSALVLLSFLLFLISCQDTENKIHEMRVSYYQQTGYGFIGPRILYRIQVEDEIGSNEWNGTFEIEDFEYEWGYTYDILIAKDYYDEVRLDAPSFRYIFLKELSKEKVQTGTQFDLILKRTHDEGAIENFVEGSEESGFTILGTKAFECSDLCDELVKEREDRTLLTGTFEFLENGEIRLVEIKSQFFR